MNKFSKILILLLNLLFLLQIESTPTSTKGILETADWVESSEDCKDWYLEFKEGNVFVDLSCMGSDFRLEGKTKILGNSVTLLNLTLVRVTYEEESAEQAKKTLNNAKCLLKESQGTFKFAYMLECNNKIFYNRGIPLPPGKTTKINNTNVITMGGEQYTTTDNVKIREAPSTESKSIKYVKAIDEGSTDSIPKGTTVTVYARTMKKEKVKNWENYWYFIDVGWNKGVWVFGEFFKKTK